MCHRYSIAMKDMYQPYGLAMDDIYHPYSLAMEGHAPSPIA